MKLGHAIERITLVKLVNDYCNRHRIEYHPNLQVRFQRVAKDIQQHVDKDGLALCDACRVCDGDSCKLS